MSVPRPLAEELRAALAARDELGPGYDGAFLARIDEEIDARIERRLAAPDRAPVPPAVARVVIALGSIGLGVTFALVARDLGALGGTVATVFAWLVILAVNLRPR